MASLKPVLVLSLLVHSTLIAEEAKVSTLMSKDLTEFPGNEGIRFEFLGHTPSFSPDVTY